MTMTLSAWVDAVQGQSIGSGECVALTNSYNVQVVGSPPVPTSGDNYAITAYQSFPLGGMDKWYTKVGPLGPFKPGDQVFWNRGSLIAPVSHTAVILADLGPVVDVMSQNTNGHRYAERVTLPRAGIAGALRPINPGSVDGLTGSGSGDMTTVGLVDTVTGAAAVAATWGKILAWIQDPANWRRIGIALLGIILILIALVRVLNINPVNLAQKVVPHG